MQLQNCLANTGTNIWWYVAVAAVLLIVSVGVLLRKTSLANTAEGWTLNYTQSTGDLVLTITDADFFAQVAVDDNRYKQLSYQITQPGCATPFTHIIPVRYMGIG